MKLFSQISGEGAPLIIMHGVFGMGDNWATLGRKWSEHFQVHLLDMRNHGRSPHSDEFSYPKMSDDLVEYLDNKNIEKANLIGHSMGGKAAMLFACQNPEKIAKLVVADIAPKKYKPHHQAITDALQALDLENIKSRSEAEKQFKIQEESVQQFLLKSLYWKEKNQLAFRFNVDVIAREVSKVNEPLPDQAVFYGKTLFVRGGNSQYILDEDFGLIHDHFPKAKMETIQGAGHWLHAEKPRAFFEVVHRFFEDGG